MFFFVLSDCLALRGVKIVGKVKIIVYLEMHFPLGRVGLACMRLLTSRFSQGGLAACHHVVVICGGERVLLVEATMICSTEE